MSAGVKRFAGRRIDPSSLLIPPGPAIPCAVSMTADRDGGQAARLAAYSRS
jgi:hypothetical protein